MNAFESRSRSKALARRVAFSGFDSRRGHHVHPYSSVLFPSRVRNERFAVRKSVRHSACVRLAVPSSSPFVHDHGFLSARSSRGVAPKITGPDVTTPTSLNRSAASTESVARGRLTLLVPTNRVNPPSMADAGPFQIQTQLNMFYISK